MSDTTDQTHPSIQNLAQDALTKLGEFVEQLIAADKSNLQKDGTTTPTSTSSPSRSKSEPTALSIYNNLLVLVTSLHNHVFVPSSSITSTSSSPSLPASIPPAIPSGFSPSVTSPPPLSYPKGDQTTLGDELSLVNVLQRTVSEQSKQIQKLRIDLDVEKGVEKMLRNENAQLRKGVVELLAKSEVEEEALTNRLLQKIHTLNQEKAKIIEQVEREEEFLTNSLQKKLIQLQREKIEIENQLEQEQENLVNRFVKQLEGMKVAANAGSGGTSCGTATLGIDTESHHRRRATGSSVHSHSGSALDLSSSPGGTSPIDVMRSEIQGLKHKLQDLEKDNNTKTELLKTWRDELLLLRQKVGLTVDDLFNEERQRIISAQTSPRSGTSHVPLFSLPQQSPTSRPTSAGTSRHQTVISGSATPTHGIGRSRTASSEILLPAGTATGIVSGVGLGRSPSRSGKTQ
ncbi:hypothetical protein BKA69DRAFT_1064623 [Paraphysoderma sedebokerense]|nr:hypothetical protein BKA69DRAFT_1064623 [Paraphysoderma sedebokerense]